MGGFVSSTWVRITDGCEISYETTPGRYEVEFTIGGMHGLGLHFSEGGLEHFATQINAALRDNEQ